MDIFSEVEHKLNAINNRTKRDWLEKNISTLRKFFEETTVMLTDDEHFDFFLSFPYYDIYKSIYNLFNKLAPTPKNAEIIYHIFAQMPEKLIDELNNNPMMCENDIPKLLSKWQNKTKVKHEDYLYFIEHRNSPYKSDEYDKIAIKCFYEEYYITCRFYLARMHRRPSEDLLKFKDSDDVALRMVFYNDNNFNWSDEYHLTRDRLKAYYDKDKHLAFECIIENMTIYPRKEHQLLILRSTGKRFHRNRFMENLHKFQNQKKELWELADELCDKIEEEERQEIYAKDKAQEEYIRQQKLEDNFVKIHKLIAGLKGTIISSFILMSIGIAGLVWLITSQKI